MHDYQGQPSVQPHNIEAEQALLGTLLVSNDVLDAVAGTVEVDDFFDPVHGRIFDLICRMIAKKALASPITLKSFMAEDEGLAALGGEAYLTGLAGAVLTLRAAPDYAATIAELAVRRRMIAASEDLAALARRFDPNLVIEDVIAEAAELTSFADATRVERGRPSKVSIADAALAGVRDACQATGGRAALPTHLRALDEIVGGLYASDLTVLGGRPGMGKSAVAIEIARRVAACGAHVTYATLEMTPEDVALRMIAARHAEQSDGVIRFGYADLRRGRVTGDELRDAISLGHDYISSLPLTFIAPHVTELSALTREIHLAIRNARRAGETPSLIIVDHMSNVRTGSASARPFERMTEVSGGMLRMAKETGLPVIALAQLSRAVENRDDKRPGLSDLRDSGSIEQDADTVILAYREEYYLERQAAPEKDAERADYEAAKSASRGLLDLHVAKQRNGPIGTARLRFLPRANLVTGVDRDLPIDDASDF